jgi:hypothetical protein
MAEFMILPPLIFAVLLGLLELYFLSVDEHGMHWLQHGLHTMPSNVRIHIHKLQHKHGH